MAPNDEERRRRNRIVRELVGELEARSPGERDHSGHVAAYAVATAAELLAQEDRLLAIRYAAELHDVGKVPPFGLDRDHPIRGADLMSAHSFLEESRSMVLHHHEWWNGSGYPEGLAGHRIPLGSRIIAVAEAFDAMTMPWGWREKLPEKRALEEIWNQSGRQFDPAVVRAFLKIQPLVQPVGL